MSGHSKWATTKRAKAVVDAKRGAMFTKFSKLISVAARHGDDPEMNFSLRIAIDKAKAVNMPKENIERAIKRGSGTEGGAALEELVYEGVGPLQSQFIIKCLTDNRNRAAANVRHAFSKFGGSLGAVAWNFEQKGIILITTEALTEAKVNFDDLELDLIDAGVDDILQEEEGITIYTHPEDMQKIKQLLEDKKINTESAEVEPVAKEKTTITSEEDKEKVERFTDILEEDEDISDYYHNLILD